MINSKVPQTRLHPSRKWELEWELSRIDGLAGAWGDHTLQGSDRQLAANILPAKYNQPSTPGDQTWKLPLAVTEWL